MATVLYPWQILVAAMAGWITRQQGMVVDYLREENRILKQQLGRRRLRLTDAQRRRLAVRGKAIGWQALAEVASLVTPDTILRWHRELIAQDALGILPFTGLLILVPVLNGHVEAGGVTIAVVLKHRGGHATTGGT